MSASTALSVSICRISRTAAGANRRAHDDLRGRAPQPAPSSRSATLAQAMSSTKPDRAEQHEQRLPRVAPTTASWSGVTAHALVAVARAGTPAASRAAMPVISACDARPAMRPGDGGPTAR